jgi:tetratricopeptide (TPR) repeat protein
VLHRPVELAGVIGIWLKWPVIDSLLGFRDEKHAPQDRLDSLLTQLRFVGRKMSQLYHLLIDLCYPYPFSVHSHEINGLIEAEEYDKAREILLRELKSRDDIKEPKVVDYLLLSLAATWLFTDKYQETISFFSEYIRRYPRDLAAYVARAAALWYSGQLEQAIDDYSRALELKPNDILSLSGRGQVLAETGRSKRAMDDLNMALEELKMARLPNWRWKKWYEQVEAHVRRGRGIALDGLGEHVLAMAEFDLSMTLNPENAWVHYDRACLYEAAGHPEKAFSEYQIALAKNGPPLNPIRKQRAQARLREIPSR